MFGSIAGAESVLLAFGDRLRHHRGDGRGPPWHRPRPARQGPRQPAGDDPGLRRRAAPRRRPLRPRLRARRPRGLRGRRWRPSPPASRRPTWAATPAPPSSPARSWTACEPSSTPGPRSGPDPRSDVGGSSQGPRPAHAHRTRPAVASAGAMADRLRCRSNPIARNCAACGTSVTQLRCRRRRPLQRTLPTACLERIPCIDGRLPAPQPLRETADVPVRRRAPRLRFRPHAAIPLRTYVLVFLSSPARPSEPRRGLPRRSGAGAGAPPPAPSPGANHISAPPGLGSRRARSLPLPRPLELRLRAAGDRALSAGCGARAQPSSGARTTPDE